MNAKFLPAVLLGLLLSCDRQVGESAGPSDTYTLSPRLQLVNATTLPEVDSVRIRVLNANSPSAAPYYERSVDYHLHGDTIRGVPRGASVRVTMEGVKVQPDGTRASWWSGTAEAASSGTQIFDVLDLPVPVRLGDTSAPRIAARSGDTVESVDTLLRLRWSVSGDSRLVVVVAGDTVRRLSEGGDSAVWTRRWATGDSLQVQASFRDSSGNVRLDTVRAVRRQRVRTPVFLTPAGNYSDTVRIRFSDSTSGASLEASLDTGRTWRPADAGILLGSDALVQVRATKPGWTSSAIREGSFRVRAAAPEFSPPGSRYDTTQLVAISTPTAGASIRYTTDGSEPTSASLLYEGPVRVAAAQTLKARAFKSGLENSGTGVSVYVIDTVATPAIGLPGGGYDGTQTVSVTCATARSEIRYTLDGTEPTTSSALYAGPVQVSSSSTLRAAAFRAGMVASPVAQETYRIAALAPTFQPPGGRYDTTQLVAISTPTAGASIRYTTDGTEPTAASLLYAGPVRVAVAQTLKARAFKSGLENSGTGVADYVIDTVAMPVFGLAAGPYIGVRTTTLSTTTPGATIRYTLDGTLPTGSSPIYAGSLILDSTETVTAIAMKDGMVPSPAASARYVLTADSVVFSVPSGTVSNDLVVVKLASATPGASFEISTDSLSWNAYADSLVLGSSTPLFARAVRAGMSKSGVAKSTYTIRAAKPAISVQGGTYNAYKVVRMTTGTPGGQIRYTRDGSAPTSTSPLYADSLVIDSTCQLKAATFKPLLDSSEVDTATYSLVVPPLSISVPNNQVLWYDRQSRLRSGSSVDIRCTKDGTEPGPGSPDCIDSVVVSAGITLKAIAYSRTYPKLEPATASWAYPSASWNTGIAYGTMTDPRDGTIYRTVAIGGRTWLAQNLNYRKSNGSSDTVGRCPKYSTDSCAKYGRLYDWPEAMGVDPSTYDSVALGASDVNHRGICPANWHVPSKAEWMKLVDSTVDSATSARILLAVGLSPSFNVGTDQVGFHALPAGTYYPPYKSFTVGSSAEWWSASETSTTSAWSVAAMTYQYVVRRPTYTKVYNFSLRCVAD